MVHYERRSSPPQPLTTTTRPLPPPPVTTRPLKLYLLGETGVGKTALLQRFALGKFNRATQMTIGVEFMRRDVVLDRAAARHVPPMSVSVQLWDTAGQERYRAIVPAFYRAADAIALVYDVCDRATFDALVDFHWPQVRRGIADEKTVVALIGNKLDLEDDRQVEADEARRIAEQHDLLFFETSAADNVDVDEAFERIIYDACDRLGLLQLHTGEDETDCNRQQGAVTSDDLAAAEVVSLDSDLKSMTKQQRSCCT